jgi:hypothetical protein
MESKYWILLLIIPVIWYWVSLSYQLVKLFCLWIKYKLENIKDKEYSLWD